MKIRLRNKTVTNKKSDSMAQAPKHACDEIDFQQSSFFTSSQMRDVNLDESDYAVTH